MDNNLVRYSRLGDIFHYRWAARRCLKLVDPRSGLRKIVIEGSNERTLKGEYVIDVAEYSELAATGEKEVTYFQLKHSTKRADQTFTLSCLKDTVVGFANRYKEHFCKRGQVQQYASVIFAIITNRPISDKLKDSVFNIGNGVSAGKSVTKTLEKYTKLKGERLQRFCASLKFIDGEGDYNAQRHALHAEISELVAGVVDPGDVDSVVAIVSNPDNWHRPIVCEEILKRLGCNNIDDLFPAPDEYESTTCTIIRKQHDSFLRQIYKTTSPLIIHASGGVGKSMLARQLADSLSIGSVGIVYDCFGSGKYRNRSRPRHRNRDALVQIANELAKHGLCKFLIPRPTDLDDALLRAFLDRLKIAAENLRHVNKDAVVAIFIDAADNAEMAAEEFNEPCFASQLLRETVPCGCRIIALCRTERVNLLRASNLVQRLPLNNFSEDETLVHLQSRFPAATEVDAREFYRLTDGGNPRIQAYALTTSSRTISEVLASLGPTGSTVDLQISMQIESAMSQIKDMVSANFQKQIESICLGLANLPPLIPIDLLAAVAEVDIETIRSFVADLGRPLMVSGKSVQFRDEPTETWFLNNYSASVLQVQAFVTNLKPYASEYPYAAEALPQLLLKSECLDELIGLALTDDLLPENSPIDARNIRVYRLQFAFKAALKKKRYADAVKLAFRAGEEVAGDNRQLEIIKNNIDLISPLQSEQRVEELAFRRLLYGTWNGSENVYSASLLSSVEEFKGDARAYLRAAENWLRLYFEERDKKGDDTHIEELTDNDIVELAITRLNLSGPESMVKYILGWKPFEVIFRVGRLVIKRLVDAGEFSVIDEISRFGQGNQYLMIAIADELLAVGKYPPRELLTQSLSLLAKKATRIPNLKRNTFDDKMLPAIVSFVEACAANGMSKSKLQGVLRHYIPQRATRIVCSEHFDEERTFFLRGVALRYVLDGVVSPDVESLTPTEILNDKDYRREQDTKEFKEVVGGLLSWFVIRARLLVGDTEDIGFAIKEADRLSVEARAQRYREYDRIPYELSRVQFDILVLSRDLLCIEVEELGTQLSGSDSRFWLNDRLRALRAACRQNNLSGFRDKLEQNIREEVDSASDEGPETIAGWYIDLARALLPVSRADAAAYFDCAIEAVSKFGDEIVERWRAVVAMAKRCAEGGHTSPEVAYRFIRCAELVGDNVAREKYFDRNEAVSVCAKLCPSSAFAALSRWRDRDIGWIDSQLPALAHEVVTSNFIPPAIAWALSAFSWEYGFDDFAELCIEKATVHVRRQHILDTAVRDLHIKDNSATKWQILEAVAKRFSLFNTNLDYILGLQAKQSKESAASVDRICGIQCGDNNIQTDWANILGDIDLTTSAGISRAIDRFKALPFPRYPEVFWEEIYKRVTDSNARDFLQAIAFAESAGRFEVQSALSHFPDAWRNKASVKRAWAGTLSAVAKRFAPELTRHYGLGYFRSEINIEDNKLSALNSAIMTGLADSSDLLDAETFFGFVDIATNFLTPNEATGLLDFALARFEEHVEEDYADGQWDNWLRPPTEVHKAFSGFIWAALGSPRSSIRWQAAHSVRRLSEMGCSREIDNLIEWMMKGTVDAFGSNKFPFYGLHATQYLLMALARVAIENPGILKRHYKLFTEKAISDMPHLLIQKYAADIALYIEAAFPGTYADDIVVKLRQVGVSSMPHKEVEGYDNKLETPWHAKGEVDNTLEFHFGYDFDRYWFEPLGEVFGVSAKQVEELARNVVINDWHMKLNADSFHDPRTKLFRRGNNQETWHSHSSYPRTDDYRFYLSYHAMLTVAAKLIEVMPVVRRACSYEDEWSGWCRRHFLTRIDGKWLADRRDPAPLERGVWVKEICRDTWREEVTADNFLNALLRERDGEAWLNIAGWWRDCVNDRVEDISIYSSLVLPCASDSLLNALSTCKDPGDYKLPDYRDESMEFDCPPFVLQGWVQRESADKGIDRFDPYAGKIDYPPARIGESFAESFGLTSDLEQRQWFMPEAKQASLVCELWGSSRLHEDRDELHRQGKRLSASLEFLKKFCLEQECELVIAVRISRQLHRSYYARRDDDDGYKPPYSKVYILSADGRLRDKRANYKLR